MVRFMNIQQMNGLFECSQNITERLNSKTSQKITKTDRFRHHASGNFSPEANTQKGNKIKTKTKRIKESENIQDIQS